MFCGKLFFCENTKFDVKCVLIICDIICVLSNFEVAPISFRQKFEEEKTVQPLD